MHIRDEVDVAAMPAKPAMLAIQPRAVVCLTNHERPDCAHINMEIIKLHYPQPWPVVHACSGADYTPYLEDVLVRCQPRTIIHGALNLLRQSCRAAIEEYNPRYLIHLEADTWVFDQRVLQRYLDLLDSHPEALIAASSWSTDQRPKWREKRNPVAKLKLGAAALLRPFGSHYGIKRRKTLSTQFFIVRNDPRFFAMLDALVPSQTHTLEHDFYHAFVAAFGRKAIIGMPEREPVHPDYRHWCEPLSLYCQHWPEQLAHPGDIAAAGGNAVEVAGQYFIPGKKEILAARGVQSPGPAMRRLLESECTLYYNPRAKRY